MRTGNLFYNLHIHAVSAVPAVVSSVRLNAAALGTFVHHLSWFELQAFDEFFRSVPFRYSSLEERGEKVN